MKKSSLLFGWQPHRPFCLHWVLRCLTLAAAFLSLSVMANLTWADCQPQNAGVLMATPISSRLDRVGDTLQAVLERPLRLGPELTLPSGTMLKGRVLAVKRGEPRGKQPGKIQFIFTQASNPAFGALPITAMPNREGGWLQQKDVDTDVWQVSLTHSTRLLNDMLQRRLGTNQAVWAASLGISENVIPDITSDEFIEQYHRNNVLVGAGDRIYLRFTCP